MERAVLINYSNPNHPTSFGSISQVYDFYKPHLSIEEVKRILRGAPAYTSRRQQRRVKLYAPTFAYFPRYLFQIDLVDVSYISAQNRGIKYLLTIIDCASRFLFVIELKNKRGKYVAEKFKKFLSNLKIKPKRIDSDRGSEFISRDFKSVLKEFGIKQSHPKTSQHSALVERVNQTLQGLMHKYLVANGGGKYIDKLQSLVKLYNNRKHSSISPLTPNEAEHPRNKSKLVRRILKNYTKVYLKSRKIKIDLKVGDKVVPGIEKKTFHRGYKDQYTDQVHTVVTVDQSKFVPLYKLQSDADGEILDGFFYREQLQKVTPGIAEGPMPKHRITKRRGPKNNMEVFVVWEGLPKIFNSWTPMKILNLYK